MPIFAAAAATLFATTFAVSSSKKKGSKAPAKKPSPMKANLTKIEISSTKKMKQLPYYLKIMLLKPGNLEMIWCIKGHQPGNDGFTHPVTVALTAEEETAVTRAFRDAGFLAKFNRRLGPDTNEKAFNSHDGFPRIVFIRYNEDSTPESRIAGLEFFKDFIEKPENNRFSYQYIVNDDSDLTPPDESLLEPMSTYLLDQQLVQFMEQILEGAGPQWYSNNEEIANDYFAGPAYPQCAIDALGYPADNGGNGANHRNFNAAPANET